MIRKPASPDTFYETVSDLMFGTMAIMVMLMCVFMALNKPSEAAPPAEAKIKDLGGASISVASVSFNERLPEEQDVAALEKQLDEVNEKLVAARSKKSELANLAASLQSQDGKEIRNVELTVMIDVTGSMQREIDELRESIVLLGQSMPRIVREFRVSIVAHRRDQSNRDLTRVFPMQRIQRLSADRGASLNALEKFAAPIAAQPGSAPFENALSLAMQQFSSPDQFDGQQALMIIGDVGPYEDQYQDQSVSTANQASESVIRGNLAEWVNAGIRRRAVLIYTGVDEIEAAMGSQRTKFERSRTFFKSLAEAVANDDAYSESPGDILPLLVLAALG